MALTEQEQRLAQAYMLVAQDIEAKRDAANAEWANLQRADEAPAGQRRAAADAKRQAMWEARLYGDTAQLLRDQIRVLAVALF